MGPIWFLRMAQWARRPPSRRRVLLWAGVIAVCAALVALELLFGWPEALRVTPSVVPKPRLTAP